jgi:hypothetical protein
MKNLTRLLIWTALVAVFFLCICLPALFAQAPDPAAPAIPASLAEYWTLAISGLSPVIVWAVSKLNVPRNLLPLLSPVVGIGLGLLLNWLGATHLGWVDMAKAGALAVFIREAINQNVTQKLQAPTPPSA